MSIIITNVTPPGVPNSHTHHYVVRINNQPPIAAFSHVRDNGLAACLRAAADAVEAAVGKVSEALDEETFDALRDRARMAPLKTIDS